MTHGAIMIPATGGVDAIAAAAGDAMDTRYRARPGDFAVGTLGDPDVVTGLNLEESTGSIRDVTEPVSLVQPHSGVVLGHSGYTYTIADSSSLTSTSVTDINAVADEYTLIMAMRMTLDTTAVQVFWDLTKSVLNDGISLLMINRELYARAHINGASKQGKLPFEDVDAIHMIMADVNSAGVTLTLDGATNSQARTGGLTNACTDIGLGNSPRGAYPSDITIFQAWSLKGASSAQRDDSYAEGARMYGVSI